MNSGAPKFKGLLVQSGFGLVLGFHILSSGCIAESCCIEKNYSSVHELQINMKSFVFLILFTVFISQQKLNRGGTEARC